MSLLHLFLATVLLPAAPRFDAHRFEFDVSDASATKVSYQSELAVTNQIVDRIYLEEGFSRKAENLWITTDRYIITLYGPVASAAEKARILNYAKQAAGYTFKVVDKMWIEP